MPDCSYFKLLFTHADGTDKLLMFVGYFACVVSGVALPSMSLLFGNLSGGITAGKTDEVVD
jgi:hypothetical protein